MRGAPPGLTFFIAVPRDESLHPSKPNAGSLGTPALGYDYLALRANSCYLKGSFNGFTLPRNSSGADSSSLFARW